LIIVKYLILIIVFHPLTYEGGSELTKIQDPVSRRAIEIQVSEYGQTPKQLFKNPHPKRFSSKISEIFLNDSLNKLKLEDENKDYNKEVTSKKENVINNLDNLTIENFSNREIKFNFDRTYTQLAKFHKK